LVLVISIAVFLTTLFVVLALYWLMEGRRESLPQRLKEIATFSPREGSGWTKGIGERFGGVLESLKRKERIKEDIVAMVTSEQLAGTRMMLSQAGYRHRVAYQVYFWVRAILPLVFLLQAIK
jgi:hypothetical protein